MKNISSNPERIGQNDSELRFPDEWRNEFAGAALVVDHVWQLGYCSEHDFACHRRGHEGLQQVLRRGLMAIYLSLLGILLFLINKRFMFQADTGKALYSGFLEVPVDANLVGFMLGIATISQLQNPNEHASITIIGSIILMNLSIIVWKYSCSLMSDRDAEVFVSRPKILFCLTLLNIVFAIAAISLPIYALGVKS